MYVLMDFGYKMVRIVGCSAAKCDDCEKVNLAEEPLRTCLQIH
jgi:hypothetical protein